MNIKPTWFFEYPTYTLQNVDGIDMKVVDVINIFSCRITELSTKDLQKLNWVVDTTNNIYKLYSNDIDNFDIIIWDRIDFETKKYKIIRAYKPKNLRWKIEFTKIYIQKMDE